MQFAGNVLVYGALSPSDGDWFGGLNADNAERFMDALLELQVCAAPPHASGDLPEPAD